MFRALPNSGQVYLVRFLKRQMPLNLLRLTVDPVKLLATDGILVTEASRLVELQQRQTRRHRRLRNLDTLHLERQRLDDHGTVVETTIP